MSISPPPSLDPNSAWAYQQPPLADARPSSLARALVTAGAVAMAAVAGALLVIEGARVVDFISPACNIVACPGPTVAEHFRVYGEAALGLLAALAATRTGVRGLRVLRGSGHVASFERSLLATLLLCAGWAFLFSG